MQKEFFIPFPGVELPPPPLACVTLCSTQQKCLSWAQCWHLIDMLPTAAEPPAPLQGGTCRATVRVPIRDGPSSGRGRGVEDGCVSGTFPGGSEPSVRARLGGTSPWCADPPACVVFRELPATGSAGWSGQ